MLTRWIAAVTIASATAVAAEQGARPLPEMKPYPGSVAFCSGHVTGAPQRDGTPGAHVEWTAYHATDMPGKIAAHYLKTLGAGNHQREGKVDIWRFPLIKPVQVLSVTPTPAELPTTTPTCKAPPAKAQTVIVISSMARP